MPKFVLIDPSVEDFQGHYYEHAMRVLKAAETRGWSPLLGANRRFKGSSAGDVAVYPVYKYAFWLSSTGSGLLPWLWRSICRIRRGIALHGPLRRRPTEVRFPAVGGVSPWQHLCRACRSLPRLLGTALKANQFARDTHQLFRKVSLAEGDCVLIACASAVEAAALASFFRRDPQSSLADWHLTFRHQLYPPDQEQPSGSVCRTTKKALAKLQRSLAGHRVHFYTDTADLAQHYNMLGVCHFQPLPVPVSDEFRPPRREAGPRAPLRIAYIGDARDEKGYHYLPRIVKDLWAEYVETGRVEFTIQSNLAAGQGTPESLVARSQLALLPRQKVTLIDKPLDPAAYRELVLGADLILLPYDNPGHYFAGSSGILAEALAAGIPVVVPAGTWLSIQLMPPVASYHRDLRRQLPPLETRHGVGIHWSSEGDPWAEQSADGRLQLGGRRRRCLIPVCDSATHLLFSFQAHAHRRGAFLELVLAQYGDCCGPISQETRVVGGDNSPASVLIELRPDACQLMLQCRNAFNGSLIELTDVRFDFLRSPVPLPLSAVGTVFSRPGELTAAVREVIEHHPHYQNTARRFSTDWVSYHRVGHLVDLLLRNTRQVIEPAGETVSRFPLPVQCRGEVLSQQRRWSIQAGDASQRSPKVA